MEETIDRRCGTCERREKGNENLEVLKTRRYKERCCTIDPKKGNHENDEIGCFAWVPIKVNAGGK